MANYWRLVRDVIIEADVLLIIADARFPDESANIEVLDKIKASGKKYLIVFNKCDLITAAQQAALEGKYEHYVFMSATKHVGNIKLLKKINAMLGGKGVVGILGYPNMGKSSVINSIRGRKSAPVSSVSGFTRGIQKVRVTRNVMLIDTPGVIPYDEKDEFLQVLIGSKHASKLKDPEYAALLLLEHFKGKIEKHYGVSVSDDLEDTLDAICLKRNMLKKGGKPDTKRMAKRIIEDWQTGKIK